MPLSIIDRKRKNKYTFFQCVIYMFISIYLLKAHMPGIVQGTEYTMNKTAEIPGPCKTQFREK